MTANVPGTALSTQCVSLGKLGAGRVLAAAGSSSLAVNNTVDTGATVTFSCMLLPEDEWRGLYWVRSAMKPAPGTLSLSSASETSQAVYFSSSPMAWAGTEEDMVRICAQLIVLAGAAARLLDVIDSGRVECVVYARKLTAQNKLALLVVIVGNAAHTSSRQAGRPISLGEAMALGAMEMDAPSSAGQGRERFRTGRASLGIAGRAARLLLLGEGLSRRAAAAENQWDWHAGDRSTRKGTSLILAR